MEEKVFPHSGGLPCPPADIEKLAVGGFLNWDSCQVSKATFLLSDIFHFKVEIGSNIYGYLLP